jgi:hypothetical protein
LHLVNHQLGVQHILFILELGRLASQGLRLSLKATDGFGLLGVKIGNDRQGHQAQARKSDDCDGDLLEMPERDDAPMLAHQHDAPIPLPLSQQTGFRFIALRFHHG